MRGQLILKMTSVDTVITTTVIHSVKYRPCPDRSSNTMVAFVDGRSCLLGDDRRPVKVMHPPLAQQY